MKTIIGNWKMEVGTRESIALARATLMALRGRKALPEVVICPAYVALSEIRKIVARSKVNLGAQDMFWEENGAYTGEISPRMLEEHAVSHVIIGHSERRKHFNETNEMVNKKVLTAVGHGLTPIICVGENKEQRKNKETFAVLDEQVRAALSGMALRNKDRIYIAYEPIWAIGSGKADTPADAQEVHGHIRSVVEGLYKQAGPEQISILYGGSVNDENAYSFLREDQIDGLLVGGASVKMSVFNKILDAAVDVMEGSAS